jgi:biopolymer transport protein ExbB/TolQ
MMPPLPLAEIVAQALPDPASTQSVGWIVVTVASLAVGLNAILSFWKNHIRGNPAPADTFATKDELDMAHGRISRERRDIDAEIRRVELASEKRADRVELKLDTNTAMTAEMQGEVKHMNQTVNHLAGSLTNFMRDQAR